MNTNNRIYQYIGTLKIKKSSILKNHNMPHEDIVPWLFLVLDNKGERRFTFFYMIEHPETAFYDIPFNIRISFIMEEIQDFIEFNKIYDVWRGEEFIGQVKIIEKI